MTVSAEKYIVMINGTYNTSNKAQYNNGSAKTLASHHNVSSANPGTILYEVWIWALDNNYWIHEEGTSIWEKGATIFRQSVTGGPGSPRSIVRTMNASKVEEMAVLHSQILLSHKKRRRIYLVWHLSCRHIVQRSTWGYSGKMKEPEKNKKCWLDNIKEWTKVERQILLGKFGKSWVHPSYLPYDVLGPDSK